ncbi:MAG: sensor domain-containing phosphodiesterase [Gaiellaceae bacterium]
MAISKLTDIQTAPVVDRHDTADVMAIAECVPHLVWVARNDGRVEYMNLRCRAFTGASLEGMSENGWLELVHPDDRKQASVAWAGAKAAAVDFELTFRARRADGQYRWVAARAVPLLDDAGELDRWVGTWTDVDEHQQAELELRETRRSAAEALALLDALQATAPVAVALVQRDLTIVRVNDTLAHLCQKAPELLRGRKLPEAAPDVWARVDSLYAQVLATGEALTNEEVVYSYPDDQPRHYLCSYYPVRVGDEIVAVGTIGIDITERREAEEFRSTVVNNMAEGLYAVDRDGRITFANAAAVRLLGWAEEELIGLHAHETLHYQHADGSPFLERECPLLEVRTTGVARREEDDTFTRKDSTLIPVAWSSAPLVTAGTVNGAVIVFRDTTDEQTERARARRELDALAWVGRIREAIDEDRLVLHAQPIVPLKGGVHAEELLVRLVTRDGDTIPPGSFLPIAEKYGLIEDIDRWVISRGLEIAKDGRRVEINLSANSIGNPKVLSHIKREFNRTGVRTTDIVFEITETALMNNLDAGETFAHNLTALGCRLALDDFGTGFGSFTYLKRLPIDYLKIDVDFVRDLPTSTANQNVVRGIVNLAQAFGQQTIAEGVEDAATLTLLKDYGVDFAQGFHLGRPRIIRTTDRSPLADQ